MFGELFVGLIYLAIFLFVVWRFLEHLKKLNERHIDLRGDYRNGYGKLIHRDIAYKEIYQYPLKHKLRFGDYDIHHIDKNKLNNSVENLEILTREQHKKKHGF